MLRMTVIAALTAVALGGQNRISAPPRPEPQRVPLKMFVPLGLARFFGSGELWLQNRGGDAKPVSFIWTLDGGKRVEGSPVTLPPQGVEFLDFGSLLPAGAHLGNVTALEMGYRGIRATEVSAWLTLYPLDATSLSQALDVPATIPEDLGQSTLDTAWPEPRGNERAIITLVNTSAVPVVVDVLQQGAAPEPITLGAYGTHLIDRRAIGPSARAEWLRIETRTTGPSPVRAAGFVRSAADRIPHILRFHDASDAVTEDLFATGVRMRNTAIFLALANVSDVAQSATVSFFDPSGGQPVVEFSVPLHARSAELIDVGARITSELASGTAAVRVDGNGPRGSLLGSLQAVDRITGLGFDAPFSDVVRKNSGVGYYPWRLDGDYDATMSISNFGSAGQFTLYMRNGVDQYGYGIQRLAAGATYLMDVRAFRDSERPSSYLKRAMPRAVQFGQLHWSLGGSGADLGLLGRLEIVSVKRRVVRSISDQ